MCYVTTKHNTANTLTLILLNNNRNDEFVHETVFV